MLVGGASDWLRRQRLPIAIGSQPFGGPLLFGLRRAAATDPIENGREFLGIEPDTVTTAHIDDHAASGTVVATVHQNAAFGTLAVSPGTLVRFCTRGDGDRRGNKKVINSTCLAASLTSQAAERRVGQPQTRTSMAFCDRNSGDHAGLQRIDCSSDTRPIDA